MGFAKKNRRHRRRCQIKCLLFERLKADFSLSFSLSPPGASNHFKPAALRVYYEQAEGNAGE